MKNHKKHWYVVGNRVGARVFEQEGVKPMLKLVHKFENQKGHLKVSELVTDKQGRNDSDSGPGHSSMGSEDSSREHVLENFVREIGAYLEREAEENAFETLVLVAEPHVLGELKKAIGHATTPRLRDSVIKDLVHVANHDISEHLKDHLCMHEDIKNQNA